MFCCYQSGEGAQQVCAALFHLARRRKRAGIYVARPPFLANFRPSVVKYVRRIEFFPSFQSPAPYKASRAIAATKEREDGGETLSLSETLTERVLQHAYVQLSYFRLSLYSSQSSCFIDT